jgi:hypothetical protein
LCSGVSPSAAAVVYTVHFKKNVHTYRSFIYNVLSSIESVSSAIGMSNLFNVGLLGPVFTDQPKIVEKNRVYFLFFDPKKTCHGI